MLDVGGVAVGISLSASENATSSFYSLGKHFSTSTNRNNCCRSMHKYGWDIWTPVPKSIVKHCEGWLQHYSQEIRRNNFPCEQFSEDCFCHLYCASTIMRLLTTLIILQKVQLFPSDSIDSIRVKLSNIQVGCTGTSRHPVSSLQLQAYPLEKGHKGIQNRTDAEQASF